MKILFPIPASAVNVVSTSVMTQTEVVTYTQGKLSD